MLSRVFGPFAATIELRARGPVPVSPRHDDAAIATLILIAEEIASITSPSLERGFPPTAPLRAWRGPRPVWGYSIVVNLIAAPVLVFVPESGSRERPRHRQRVVHGESSSHRDREKSIGQVFVAPTSTRPRRSRWQSPRRSTQVDRQPGESSDDLRVSSLSVVHIRSPGRKEVSAAVHCLPNSAIANGPSARGGQERRHATDTDVDLSACRGRPSHHHVTVSGCPTVINGFPRRHPRFQNSA